MRTRARPRPWRDLVKHISVVNEVEAVAEEAGACAAQVALAWLLAQGDDIAPIPGTKRVSRLEENAAADTIGLTAGQLARLTAIAPPFGRPPSKHDPGRPPGASQRMTLARTANMLSFANKIRTVTNPNLRPLPISARWSRSPLPPLVGRCVLGRGAGSTVQPGVGA